MKVHVALLPLLSIASQTTAVFPTRNSLPDLKLHVNEVLFPELSLYKGSSQTTTVTDSYGSISIVWSAGQKLKVGASISEKEDQHLLTLVTVILDAATRKTVYICKLISLTAQKQ